VAAPASFNLQRFIDAQDGIYEVALAEIESGSKESHWMWFVFPQLSALGRSPTAKFFGLASIDEARAYLDHPLLGSRLRECVKALLGWSGERSAEDIFGSIDAMKLRSSLTLFDEVEPAALMNDGLVNFFSGERDELTLALLHRPD
jgi:uncharacterized protein (DUF1810 family)